MKTVLIVEDNPTMVRALQDNFEFKGFKVRVARDGEQGLRAAMGTDVDLIILDIMLPKVNGFEICSKVREKGLATPILMVTAKDREDDIVMGLNLGADDYVTKPFGVKELLARAEGLLRRKGDVEADSYRFGEFILDTNGEKLTRNSVEVALSPKEYKLLKLLVKKAGRVLTREEILRNAFGYSHFLGERDIDGYVKKLRGKIEQGLPAGSFIRTMSEVGYKFEPGQ
jgi:DNA-binding response OmpR family regulator